MSTSEYHSCLKDFWTQKFQTCIESVSNIILQEPTHTDLFKLYRLWTECLAITQNTSGLIALEKHLMLRSQEDSTFYPELYSLRGIIHLETNSIEAATLHYKCLIEHDEKNNYVSEFLSRYSQRTSNETNSSWEDLENFEDYFHFENLSTELSLHKDPKKTAILHKIIQKVFPQSPLPAQFLFHQAWEQKNYIETFELSKSLVEKYPSNSDYHLFVGLSCIKNGWVDQAIETLEKSLEVCAFQDPDILNTLSYCYEEVGRSYENAEIIEQSGHLAMQAKEEYQKQGLPSTLVSARFYRNTPPQENVSNTPWMIQLDNSNFYDLLTKSEREQQYISITTDAQTNSGDLCLLTGQVQYGDKKQMRIGALCRVDTPPVWHPTKGSNVALTLLHKMDHSIPLNIEFLDAEDASDERELETLTAYELDENAIQSIVEDISEFKSEQEGKIWKELLTSKIAS